MTQSKATRNFIDTHRHFFGPKLRQKFVENIGFDDSKPLSQVIVKANKDSEADVLPSKEILAAMEKHNEELVKVDSF